MPIFHLILLALIQGITEFLPISSSGHLVLFHDVMPGDNVFASHDLLMDMAVHVGTLFAVLLYFRKDLCRMVMAVVQSSKGQEVEQERALFKWIVIGSLPVIVAGFILHAIYPYWLRSPIIVAWMTIIFGVLLWVSDRFFTMDRDLKDFRLKDALWIGMAQILALIPGTSRSGITMTTARFLGVNRVDAARYSLLLGIVAISGAGALGTLDLIEAGNATLGLDVIIAALFAFVSGYIAIAFMIKWLARASFAPFVFYRIVLGLALLFFISFDFI